MCLCRPLCTAFLYTMKHAGQRQGLQQCSVLKQASFAVLPARQHWLCSHVIHQAGHTHCGKPCSVLSSLPEMLASPDEPCCAVLVGRSSTSSGAVGVTKPAFLSASWSPAYQRGE